MTDATHAAAVQIPAAGIYQLDPAASTVTFATRHMFGLAPVKGTFRLVSGQITIADPVTSSTVSAVIDAASFATGNPQRDKDVKSARFLHVRDHPPGLWLMRNPIRSHPQCTANRARASAAGTSPLPHRCTRSPAPARTELSFPRASGERRHSRRHRT